MGFLLHWVYFSGLVTKLHLEHPPDDSNEAHEANPWGCAVDAVLSIRALPPRV